MKTFILLLIFTTTFSFMQQETRYHMLCLGDSYTIGEAVAEQERFPMQAVELLKKRGITFDKPEIIAQTGWTTDELATAIKQWEQNVPTAFQTDKAHTVVTVLIGVNNQYRGRDVEEYRKEFVALLKTALHYTGGHAGRIIVISIPDWGVTPFAAKDAGQRTPQQISTEIDSYNAVNKQEALKAKVHYIDITPASREAKTNAALIAEDGLHPSGKMYTMWAALLADTVAAALHKK